MAEYIKREDAVKKVIANILYEEPPYTDSALAINRWVADQMEDLPSIDIVRCSECKYWDKAEVNYGGVEHFCNYAIPYTIQADADDYCSFGERRGQEHE